MLKGDIKAIDAIWKTELKDANEKLVLYHLASKHELGERYSTSWKSLEQFLGDFEVKWCELKDICEATRLSEVKASRTLQGLVSRNYVDTKEIPVKLKKRLLEDQFETVYGISTKIFTEFGGDAATKVASA